MRELPRTAALIGAGTICEVISSVISTKIVSLHLGPTGVGVTSQVGSYYNLGASLATLGLLLGVTRFTAEANERRERGLMGGLLATTLIVTMIAACFLALLSVVLARPLSEWMLGSSAVSGLLWLAAPGLIFLIVYRVCDSVCQGLRSARIMTQSRIIVALVAPLLTLGCVITWGVNGAVLSLALRQIIAGALALFFLLTSLSRWGLSREDLKFIPTCLRPLFRIGFSMLIVTSTIAFSMFLVRNQVVGQIGLDGGGVFQAAYGLVFLATNLVLTTLSYYTLPRVSGLSDNLARAEIMNESIAFGTLLIGGAGLALTVFREPVVRVFFRSDFSAAEGLLPLFAVGAVLYVAWWVVGTPLVVQGRLITLVVLNVIAAVSFPLFTMIGLPWLGLPGVGVAYITANLVALAIFSMDQHRAVSFRISRDNVLFLVVSVTVILAEAWIVRPDLLGMAFRIVLAGLWSVVAVRWTRSYFNWRAIGSWSQQRLKGLRGIV
jgi:O-antigen/teichoic acid export membrane protein